MKKRPSTNRGHCSGKLLVPRGGTGFQPVNTGKMPVPPRKRSENGFTLLELTAAIFVLSVGIFGTVRLFHIGVESTRTVQQENIAMRAIQNELETLRSESPGRLTPGDGWPFHSDTPELERLDEVQAALSIVDRSEGSTVLIEVTARVAWLKKNGRAAEKAATTLIANQGGTRSSLSTDARERVPHSDVRE